MAVENGDLASIEALTNSGLSVHVVDDKYLTPAHWGADKASCKGDKVMQDHWARIIQAFSGERHSLGMIALSIATYRGHLPIMEFLVNNGININAPINGGSAALWVSIRRGHLDCIAYLMQNGASLCDGLDQQFLPILSVIDTGRVDILETLVSHGDDIFRIDENGDTLLHRICSMSMASDRRGYLECLRYLLDKGVDQKTVNFKGETALDHARSSGFDDAATMLEGYLRAKAERKCLDGLIDVSAEEDGFAGIAI